MPDSYYNLQVKGWRYVRSLLVYGDKQDIYQTSQGWLVSVSKDFPLKGWHVSVHTKSKVPEELFEREVQRLFDHLEVPFYNLGPSPFSGAPNYQEDTRSKQS